MFALAIADVLLINMWTTDIGRYGASNYGLLKVIFEVNLKLFDQQCNKKLLFVLRDFDDHNDFESIKGILEKDLTTIWSEIYKPEQHANTKYSDFFQMEYQTMPHKRYQEAAFVEQAAALKHRFEIGAADSLFLSDAQQKNVPMDGMPVFVSQSWDTIRN